MARVRFPDSAYDIFFLILLLINFTREKFFLHDQKNFYSVNLSQICNVFSYENPMHAYHALTYQARLAQLVARRSHNPEVVGSIPTLCNAKHVTCTIGAVGSALVLCTDGPGFEPLMVQCIMIKKFLYPH